MDITDQHFVDNYNTELTPAQEDKFQTWLKLKSVQSGRDYSNDLADYDLRGYWLSQGKQASNGHMSDQFKKPNHPTFSDQSIYHGTTSPFGFVYQGGQWAPDGSSYTPSETMLRYTHPEQFMKMYMNAVEPNTQLILPKRQQNID